MIDFRTAVTTNPIQHRHPLYDHRSNITPHIPQLQAPPAYAEVMTALHAISQGMTKLVDGREETHQKIQKVVDVVEASHTIQSKGCRKIFDRVDKHDKSMSALVERLNKIEYSLEELVERARDPYADGKSNLSSISIMMNLTLCLLSDDVSPT